jgi:hypothetical protein
MFKICKSLLFILILLVFTNVFLLGSPPVQWPNTFSPAIGFGKKGLTLGNTKDGFTQMTPVSYTPKQPEIKIDGQPVDSLTLQDSKYGTKLKSQALDSVRYSGLNLKRISDSILQEGLALYKLEKLAMTSRELIGKMDLKNIVFSDYIQYFDADTLKVLYYSSSPSGIRIKMMACLVQNDSIKSDKIKLIREDRIPAQNELTLIDIKNEIRTMIKESPSLNENKNVMSFSIPVLKKNNCLYFYLLPVSIESNQFYMGGDYIFIYSTDKKLKSIEPQHKSLLRVHKLTNTTISAASHTHITGYSHFMTATDICQAKLYGKQTVGFTNFKVLTFRFESGFNTETNVLELSMAIR